MASSFGRFGLGAHLRRSKRRIDDPLAPPDIWIKDAKSDWITRVSALPAASEIVLWWCAARYVVPSMRANDLIVFVKQGVPIGIGCFNYALSLPIAEAWQQYGLGLGAATEVEFQTQVDERYKRSGAHDLQIVTCQIVTDFCGLDTDTARLIGRLRRMRRGKLLCSTTSEVGIAIAAQWQDRIRLARVLGESTTLWSDPALPPRLSWSRRGQQRFHDLVFKNCEGCCIVSGETAGPTLEAAHIHSFRFSANHDVTNGLLLRSDLHRLFDGGYWTIDPDAHVRFSSKFIEDYPHSGYFFEFGGRKLEALSKLASTLSPEALNWHRTIPYRA